MTTTNNNEPQPTEIIAQRPFDPFGMLNHNERATRDIAPAQPAPQQPVTTLVTTALTPKLPPGKGD